jgi:hypothetical protein
VLEIDAGIRLGLRMSPGGDVMAGGIEEGTEPELFTGSRHRGIPCKAVGNCRCNSMDELVELSTK